VREDIIKIGRKNIKCKYIGRNHLNADNSSAADLSGSNSETSSVISSETFVY